MATYVITAPNGKKYRVTGEGTKEEALAHFQSIYAQQAQSDEMLAADRVKNAPTQGMSTGDKFLAGTGKAFADLGRGALQYSADLGNVMGLGRILPKEFGDERVAQMRADAAENRRLDEPLMDTKAGMAGNITGNVAATAPAMFVPGANTAAGSVVAGTLSGAAQPVVDDSERLVNTSLGAGLGQFGHWAGGEAAQWAGNKLANRATQAATQRAQNSVRDNTIREGIDAGFSVPPATTNPGFINNALESISGKAATQSASSRGNQEVTNRLIRDDLGMLPDEPLTPDTLKSVRSRAGKVYESVKKSGEIKADTQFYQELIDLVDGNQAITKSFPGAKASADDAVLDLANSLAQPKFKAEGAVEYVKKLRSDSKSNFRAAAVNGDPSKRQLAQAQWDAAGALEEQIERHLTSIGQQDLAQTFTAARTLIAKSHSAELALNEGTGNIQANKLVQQLRKGKPMSGNFETIAKFASAAPKAMAEPTQSGGVSALSAAIAAGGAGLGSPAVMAIPAMRWAARKGILTPAVQRRMALSRYEPSRTGSALLKGTRGLGQVGAPLAISANSSE